MKQRWRKPPFYGRLRSVEKVRFRSAALSKSGRNVEFTAFLLFFCFKKFEHLSEKYEEIMGESSADKLWNIVATEFDDIMLDTENIKCML